MKYLDGEDVRLWDRVRVWSSDPAEGVVVFSIDTDEYSAHYPRESWTHLDRGVMVDTDQACLIHYSEPSSDLRLVERGAPFLPADWAALRRRGFERHPGEWQEGVGHSVRVGYVNPHGQICLGHRGVRGTDHLQYAYRTLCGWCGTEYGANGSDLHERRCPRCQGGAPGITF